MQYILKNGELKARQFKCKICGCEFVADVSDYDVLLEGGYITKCPWCNKRSKFGPHEAPLYNKQLEV